MGSVGQRGVTEKDEEQLQIQRAVHGDAAAIGDLYRRYAGSLFRYLFYRLGDRSAAEDLTSEVFLRVLEALPRYRERGRPFSAWLYRIANARVADYYRLRRRRPTVGLYAEGMGVENPEEEAASRLTAEELSCALGQLKPAHQQALLLRFVAGLSHADAARVLGRTEGGMRVLQYRALAALRRVLGEGVGGSGDEDT